MNNEMEFTGERFTPECVREIWYEHMHRYAWARDLAKGRRVLDAACGEGFGSAMLAEAASSVLGVDIDEAAVAHASRRYAQRPNLSFQPGDATALDDLPDASFDLVVSFETLEHVAAQEQMLAGFARLLAADGVLVVSTPDKAEYTDRRGFDNPYHVRELYKDEFLALLRVHFPQVRLLAQKLLFQSVLWDEQAALPASVTASTSQGGVPGEGLAYPPMYYIAVCSRQPLPPMPAVHLFGDAEESVYEHYNHEVRKNIQAGHRIAELEQQLAQAQARTPETRRWWQALFGRR